MMDGCANHRVPPDADVKLSTTTHRGPTALDGILKIPREPGKVSEVERNVKPFPPEFDQTIDHRAIQVSLES